MYLTPHRPMASSTGSSPAPASVRWNSVVATGGGALYRLMERHQLQDPFRFLIYAELAGAEIGPVATP
jgi:hypothetical protein